MNQLSRAFRKNLSYSSLKIATKNLKPQLPFLRFQNKILESNVANKSWSCTFSTSLLRSKGSVILRVSLVPWGSIPAKTNIDQKVKLTGNWGPIRITPLTTLVQRALLAARPQFFPHFWLWMGEAHEKCACGRSRCYCLLRRGSVSLRAPQARIKRNRRLDGSGESQTEKHIKKRNCNNRNEPRTSYSPPDLTSFDLCPQASQLVAIITTSLKCGIADILVKVNPV